MSIPRLTEIFENIFDGANDRLNVGVQSNVIATDAASVTPSDSTDLTGGATKGLYIGGAGNIKVDMADGTTITFTALSAGIIHPVSAKRVYATGTTATLILAVY